MSTELHVPQRARGLSRAQRGLSLVATLLLLTLVMLLGLSAYQLSQSQFTLAGNLQFRTAAFNEAEAGVATAERWLSTGTNFRSAGFTTYSSGTGQYPINYLATNAIDPLTMNWDATNSVQGANASQRYLIELLAVDKVLASSGVAVGGRSSSGCNRVNTYRVVARGENARGATTFVQTNYSVMSC
jgi:type IV pilus assembly protein PilX